MKKPDVDIVNEILEECILAYPVSSFIISLYQQYQQRGSLSKKQLQGLYGKAARIKDLPPGKLATLDAVIKKMATKFRSEIPPPKPLQQKDETVGQMIQSVLDKYPAHKRVLFLKSKYDHDEPLTTVEINDLKRFVQMLK